MSAVHINRIVQEMEGFISSCNCVSSFQNQRRHLLCIFTDWVYVILHLLWRLGRETDVQLFVAEIELISVTVKEGGKGERLEAWVGRRERTNTP